MKPTREPKDILTRFPWGSLVRWIICGIVAGPVISMLIYAAAQFCFLMSLGNTFPEALEMLPRNLVATSYRRSLFSSLTDMPPKYVVNYCLLMGFPGGIAGCVLYLIHRRREIIAAKSVSGIAD